jgi:protein-S-isoprenylcysteine O-methyltransferase Ste14
MFMLTWSMSATPAKAGAAAKQALRRRKIPRSGRPNTGCLLDFSAGRSGTRLYVGSRVAGLERRTNGSEPRGCGGVRTRGSTYNAAMRSLWTGLRRHQEAIGRWTGRILFALAIGWQLTKFPGAGALPVELARWGLVTLLFVLFWSAYWRRRPALALASRPVEILLPLVCSGLPLAQYPPAPVVELLGTSGAALWQPLFALDPRVGLLLMAAGEAFTVAGMFSLGRSFSIFSEVRELASTGLYRFVRHPLYLGEMVAVWGYVLAWPAPWAVACAALFTALQSWRAKVEERALIAHHPSYAEYRTRVGFLLPRLRR